MGAAKAVATALPVKITPRAFGTAASGTRRMTVAVDSDQNPPITTPSSARAIISTTKFGAWAIKTNEASISPVSPIKTCRRSKRPAIVAMNTLVITAKRPEIEMAWPAMPSVACRSAAIGVSRLTGMNSEAMSIATHSAIEPTALQVCRPTAAGVCEEVVSTWTIWLCHYANLDLEPWACAV